jgi:hypothetical protein
VNESMSEARIEHIGGCLSAPCPRDLAVALARQLLAEVKRLRDVERQLRATVADEAVAIGQDLERDEELKRLHAQAAEIGKTQERIALSLKRMSNKLDQDAERYADERSPLLTAQAEALWDAAQMVTDGEWREVTDA